MAVLAMGGEGGGVLADWCVDMAEHCGFFAQTTSVPGVAQRTGTTVYYVEFFPKLAGELKEPVLSTMAAPGEVDIVVASELMEAGRAVQRGFVSPRITTFIASTNRVYSMTEKMALGDGRVDSEVLLDSARKAAKVFIPADYAKIAEQSGSVISSALFGAIAGSGALPFERADFISAIERGGVGVKNSIKAFEASYEMAQNLLKPAQSSTAVAVTIGTKPKDAPSAVINSLSPEEELAIINDPTSAVGARLKELAKRIKNEFPEPARVMVVNGIKRCADYQDVDYAQTYLERLVSVKDADAVYGDGTARALEETARYTALWMTYEDTIRVADLKTRRSRYDRVGKEALIQDDQMLQVREFLHPQSDEFADTLPTSLGKWLLRTHWVKNTIERLTKDGIVLQTTAVHGYLLLYFVARLKPIRRRSLRFNLEQARIDAWIATINEVMAYDYQLSAEVAEVANVIKGYGSTHHNGWANFELIMGQLEVIKKEARAAATISDLRKAALSDENGVKLRAMLDA
jgi:indolepyruvate ferredoxin oxidoreductase beta subunit